jgi:hypothetical protein
MNICIHILPPSTFRFYICLGIFTVMSGFCFSIVSLHTLFCRSLLDLLYFFFWQMCCLFFDIRILIAPLVSSNSSWQNCVRLGNSDYFEAPELAADMWDFILSFIGSSVILLLLFHWCWFTNHFRQSNILHWIKYFIIWVSKFNVCIK